MANLIQITDGETTLDLNSVSGYCTLFGEWSPAVAARNESGLGGKPYLDVVETMRLSIRGTTAAQALQRANDLRLMLDQAARWADGENVSPVLLKYQPYSGATTYSTPILGPAGAGVENPGTFVMADTWNQLEPVTLSFIRDGLWYGDTETARPNLISNGDFESNTSPWAVANGSLGQSSTYAKSGAYSLLLTASGAGAAYATLVGADRVAVTAGNSYTLVYWSRSNNSTQTRPELVWYNSGGSVISTSGGTLASQNGAWAEVSLTATAPATAVTAEVRILRSTATPAAGALFYADDVRFIDNTSSTVATAGTTNPERLTICWPTTHDTPSPVSVTMATTGLYNAHTGIFATSPQAGDIAFLEGEAYTVSSIPAATSTTTVTGTSGGSVVRYTPSTAGTVRLSWLLPRSMWGRGAHVYITARNLSATVAYTTSASTHLYVNGGSYVIEDQNQPGSAGQSIPVSAAAGLFYIGHIPKVNRTARVNLTHTATDASNAIQIDSVIVVADTGNVLGVTQFFYDYVVSGAASLDIELKDTFDPLTQIVPTVERTGSYTGNPYLYFSGSSVSAIVAGTDGAGGWVIRDKSPFVSPFSLSATRRKAYLIPE